MKRVVLFLIALVAVVVALPAQTDSAVLVRVHGFLTSADDAYNGRPVDWFDVQAPADGRIDVVAASVDGSPVILIGAGGSVQETTSQRESSRVSRRVSEGEIVRVGVGEVSLATSAWPGAPEYMLQVVFTTGDPGLTVGGYQIGRLEPGDQESENGSYVDWYPLAVRAGLRVRVDVRSQDFDTYLVVELPSGSTMENDDASGTNSSIAFTPTTDGVARVGVQGYGYGETGEYEVSVTEEKVTEIEVGESIDGELTSGTAAYSLRGRPGQVVEINLRSFDFDTVLTVDDASGAQLSNDDYGDSTDSHLLYSFADDGAATISVGSYGGSGLYTLSVRESNASVQPVTDGYELRDGDVITGWLGPQLPQSDGMFSQRFTFIAQEGERVTITLESDSFDAYLRLVDPRGTEITDDDSAGNLNSRITFTVERSGVHDVYASSLGAGGSGLYTLSFNTMDAGNLVLSTRGQLTPNDSVDISGKSYDTYQFLARAGRTVTIDVVSASFDTQAILRDETGTVVFTDDDGGADSNSRIQFVPERTGTFELVVTSYSTGSYGNYTVSIYE